MKNNIPPSFSAAALEALLDSAETAVWEMDLVSHTLSCSPMFTRLTGASCGVDIRDFHDAYIVPGDAARIRRAFEGCRTGRITRYTEVFRLRTDGKEPRWMEEFAAVTAWNADGVPVRLTGALRDVTELKQAEDELHENLSRTESFNESLQIEVGKALRKYEQARAASKAVFESNPHMNLLFNAQGEAVGCNPVGRELFMTDSKQVLLERINGGAYERPPEYQPDGRKSIPLRENVLRALEIGTTAFETNFIINGVPVAFDVICKRLGHGDSALAVTYMTDLSRIRQAERELDEQRKLLEVINVVASSLVSAQPETFDETVRRAMERIAEAVDADRMRVWRNYEEEGEACAGEVYSWSRIAAPGTWYATRTRYAAMPYWERTLHMGQAINSRVADLPEVEKELIGRQGVVSIVVVPIFIRDAFWGFIGFDDCTRGRTFSESACRLLQSGGSIIVSSILRNEMTENLIKAREQALASSRAKTDFLSRMSHEIRTPMNAIIGMGAIAKRSDDPEKVADCLRKIDASSHQLLGIINDVLDMSKIEADKFELSENEFDFEKVLHNVFTVMQVKFDEKKQVSRYDMDTMFTRKIVGDELRLSQVLLNLTSNAAKFSPEGGIVVVKIRLLGEGGEKNRLRVEVIDDGIGVEKEARNKIFQSFEQGDGSITRRFGGTGLGLAITKKIITLMGGDIWVESSPGQGANFVFEVPLRWGGPVRDAPDFPRLRDGMRALVVDGDEDALETTAGILRSLNVLTDAAADPAKAVSMAYDNELAGTPYDIIFVNWNMPVVTGLETAVELKRVAGEGVTVVMLDVFGWLAVEREATVYGITHFLQKPVLPSALYDMLARSTGDGAAGAAPREAEKERDWRGRHILLVEDIDINREIVIDILESSGVSITTAGNGREAVKLFSQWPGAYDVILMDVQMPILDGISATRAIRELNVPEGGTVPIIAMTANAFKEDEEACRDAGMNAYLAKPIDVDALFTTLAGFLDNPEKTA